MITGSPRPKIANFKPDVRQAQDKACSESHQQDAARQTIRIQKESAQGTSPFNQEVQEALELLEDSPTLQHARDLLDKGTCLLVKRLKTADRSMNGWGVIAEYIADELADDSDNENHLEVEKVAERKAGLKK